MTPRLLQRMGASSRIGPRQTNQDSWHLNDRALDGTALVAVLGVADGMGGLNAGDVASATAISESVGAVDGQVIDGALMREAVLRADFAVRNLPDEFAGAGTTLTLCAVVGNEAIIGHVGDTRVYLLRNGLLEQVTDDHSRVGELVRNGTITEEEAMGHPEQNVLERALGAGGVPEVDIYRVALTPGDVLLLSTDGLHGVVPRPTLAEVLNSTSSLQEACDSLTGLAEQWESQDNITAVAWQFPAAPGSEEMIVRPVSSASVTGQSRAGHSTQIRRGGVAPSEPLRSESVEWGSFVLSLVVVFASALLLGLGLGAVL